jgi:hypothetical protein
MADHPIDAIFDLEAAERYDQTRIGNIGAVGRDLVSGRRAWFSTRRARRSHGADDRAAGE